VIRTSHTLSTATDCQNISENLAGEGIRSTWSQFVALHASCGSSVAIGREFESLRARHTFSFPSVTSAPLDGRRRKRTGKLCQREGNNGCVRGKMLQRVGLECSPTLSIPPVEELTRRLCRGLHRCCLPCSDLKPNALNYN